MYHTTFNVGGTINLVTAHADDDFTTKWKSVVDAASRVGKLTVRFESQGGAGVSDATKLAITADPTQIDKILTALSGLGASFNQKNSAPVNYLLISNTIFGAPIKVADASKLDTLNGYYLTLSRLDYALSRIGNYKKTFPAIYNAFYTKPVLNLRSQRNNLVAAIEACVLADKCTYQLPTDLDLLYVEDIITPDSVAMECTYQNYIGKDVQGKDITVEVLSRISVNLRGTVRMAKFVAVQAATLSRFGPDAGAVHFFPAFPAVMLGSVNEATGSARISATLDSVILRPDVSVNAGSIVINNLAELSGQRELIKDSVYSIAMQATNGLNIENTVGPPYGGSCPVRRP